MSRFRLLLLCGICLLPLVGSSCIRRVRVAPPPAPESTWKGPFQEQGYFYWKNDKGVWVFVSKIGPGKGQKELCPVGAVCNIDTVGQMYILRRGN